MNVKITAEVYIDVSHIDPSFVKVEEFCLDEAKRIMANEPDFLEFRYEIDPVNRADLLRGLRFINMCKNIDESLEEAIDRIVGDEFPSDELIPQEKVVIYDEKLDEEYVFYDRNKIKQYFIANTIKSLNDLFEDEKEEKK